MTDAREDRTPYRGQNLIVYIPEREISNLLIIEEGSGDNLSEEDIDAGFVDYLNYGSHDFMISAEGCEDIDIDTAFSDGGMVLLTEYAQKMTVGQVINTVLEHVFVYPYDAVLFTK